MCTHFNHLYEAHEAMQHSIRALDERFGTEWPHHIDAAHVERADWAGGDMLEQLSDHYGRNIRRYQFSGGAFSGLANVPWTNMAWPAQLKELQNERSMPQEQVA